jgi:hypothetical protein
MSLEDGLEELREFFLAAANWASRAAVRASVAFNLAASTL